MNRKIYSWFDNHLFESPKLYFLGFYLVFDGSKRAGTADCSLRISVSLANYIYFKLLLHPKLKSSYYWPNASERNEKLLNAKDTNF